MKKLPLLIAVCLMQLMVTAQSYVPTLQNTNVWYYSANYLPILQSTNHSGDGTSSSPAGWYTYDHYTGQDSIINSTTYKTLYQTWMYPNPGMIQGFVREDSAVKKIYYLDAAANATEYLLYDYSMQIGDSIYLPFTNYGYFNSGYYHLDSITNSIVNSAYRKVFYLNRANTHTVKWIEGIGNQGDFAYTEANLLNGYGGPFNFSCAGFPYDAGQILTCFFHDNRIYYDSCALQTAITTNCFGLNDSCHYGYQCGGLNEQNTFRNVKIFPNPSSGNITLAIESKTNQTSSIEIFDVLGKCVLRETKTAVHFGVNNINLKTDFFPEGIYTLKLSNSEQSEAVKFVIK